MTTTRTKRLAIAAVLLALYGAAPAASAAGFSCSGELTIQERLVCGDAKLSALDYRMNALYAMAREMSAGDNSLRAPQQAWLDQRAQCADVRCMEARYSERVSRLMDSLQTLSGPFPAKIDVRHEDGVPTKGEPYCPTPDMAIASFDLFFEVKAGGISGGLGGWVNCGNKVLDTDLTKGAVVGHLALVEFEEGWSSRESFTVQALVAVSKGRVYWRTLTERLAEHYIPGQYVFRMPASSRKN